MRRIWWIVSVLAASFTAADSRGQSLNLEFDDGVSGWRTVLDGVMGGRSSGRISQTEPGVLRFTGSLSLENNGGFSQMQTTVPTGSLAGADGVQLRVRGDGRTYQFDIRTSDVRLMAGAFSADFETRKNEWVTVRLPFSAFKLYNFGRLVSSPPRLRPELIESVGITLADKATGPFEIEVDFIRSLTADAKAETETKTDATQPPSLADLARANGLTTLLSLVDAAGLELPADTRITIFAPTNAAFEKIPAEKVAFLTSPEGLPVLRTILRHHIVAEALPSPVLLRARGVESLAGQRLAVDAEALSVAGGVLLATDAAFDGGVVHVVDSVLLPETRTIADLVGEDPHLLMLAGALGAAGLTSQLGAENDGPWTVLAPSNEAFAALGEDVLARIAAEPRRLNEILAAHVIPSRVYRDEMLAQGSTRSLGGGNTIAFTLSDGRVTADGASILRADIPAANGVVHIIDRVLLPDSAETSTRSENASDGMTRGVTRERALLLIERAIERGVPLFNNGNQEACAGIYEITLIALRDFGSAALTPELRRALGQALTQGAADRDPASRAWTYRRALDAAAAHLAR